MIVHLSPKERIAFLALGFLFLLVAGYVGAKQLRSRDQVVINELSPHRDSQAPAREPSIPESTQEPTTEVVVHVAGAVQRPGVYQLPAGSRVTDAIQAAGGFQADADPDQLNLAAKAIDGTRILVPRVPGSPDAGQATADNQPDPGSDASASPPAIGKHPAGPISLSSATAEELATVPGIGPSTAQRIIDYRTQHNGFHSVDELTAVGGIGQKKLSKIRQWLVP
jgi:competence protein ComEA